MAQLGAENTEHCHTGHWLDPSWVRWLGTGLLVSGLDNRTIDDHVDSYPAVKLIYFGLPWAKLSLIFLHHKPSHNCTNRQACQAKECESCKIFLNLTWSIFIWAGLCLPSLHYHLFVTKRLTEGLTNVQTIGLIDVRSHTKACHITIGAQVFRIQLDHLQS